MTRTSPPDITTHDGWRVAMLALADRIGGMRYLRAEALAHAVRWLADTPAGSYPQSREDRIYMMESADNLYIGVAMGRRRRNVERFAAALQQLGSPLITEMEVEFEDDPEADHQVTIGFIRRPPSNQESA